MKKVSLGLFFCFVSLVGLAQYNISGSSNIIERSRDIQRQVKVNNFSSGSASKSRFNIFLNEDWQGGVMFISDSIAMSGYTYRYNIYSDQIELRSIVDPSSVEVVSIGSQKFIYSKFYDNTNALSDGYFEQIVGGECKLLLRREVDYSTGTRDIEGYGTNSSTSVKQELYIKKENEPAIKIDKSKDFFKQVMSDKEEVVDYIDDQIIIFLTEKKIVEFVEYYNKI
ncbi:MAG: hypothetical protein V2I54_05495 [Bacteroidales bacterium]|jgi:hypothetical protein|nr:hypothetical protein [Bacteroidales bacterium]